MTEFDYVIVGAGAAGCVLAHRLSADSATRVLLIEAGPPDRHPFIHMPKGIARLKTRLEYFWLYLTAPTPARNGAPEVWGRGRTLGGSSSVNGMMYVRGQDADYAELARHAGEDWNWAHIGQAYKELESHELGPTQTRGNSGPLRITMPTQRDPLTDAAITAAQGLGMVRKQDVNEPEDVERVGYAPRTVFKGRRQSASVAFLRPIQGSRPNLTIVTEVTVDKLLIEGKRVGGVTGLRGGAPVTYRAAREVLLCAGSMGSPAILQRSGIGPAEHLRSLGIAEVHDSPQLGQGLREHHALVMQWKAKDVASANRQFFGLRLIANVLRYYLTRSGPMSSATYEAGAWFRTRREVERPDGQFLIAPYTFDFNSTTPAVERHGGLQLCCYILRPESAGSVMIQSSDPAQLPLVTPDFHSNPKDRQAMIDLVRYARRFVAQPAFAGLVFEETRPGPSYESDDEIIAAFDRMGTGAYHASGSCRMGLDANSVVDPRLRVRGVEGVRVVDTSVLPFLVAGNTNGPISAIAWRAADLIIEDARRA